MVDENEDYVPMTEYGFEPQELTAEEEYVITGSPRLIDDEDSLAVAEDNQVLVPDAGWGRARAPSKSLVGYARR